jgi:hypothetical protein
MSCQDKKFLELDVGLLHDALIVCASPKQEHMSVGSFWLFWAQTALTAEGETVSCWDNIEKCMISS